MEDYGTDRMRGRVGGAGYPHGGDAHNIADSSDCRHLQEAELILWLMKLS